MLLAQDNSASKLMNQGPNKYLPDSESVSTSPHMQNLLQFVWIPKTIRA